MVGLVFAALAGLAIILFSLGMVGPAGGALEGFVDALRELMLGGLYWLALLSPAIIPLAALFIFRQRSIRELVFAGIYGIALMLILHMMGLFTALANMLHDTLFYSSLTSVLLGLKEAAVSVFGFLAGLALRFVDYVLIPVTGTVQDWARRLSGWLKKHARW